MKIKYLLLTLVVAIGQPVRADEVVVIPSLVEAATAFWDQLNEAQQKQVQIPFVSRERMDWHYFPKARKGIALAAMNEEQKELAVKWFQTILSDAGYQKVKGIIAAERVLWENSGYRDSRNPEKYYVTLFGKPSTTENWGFSLEGHHLSVNVTILEGRDVFVTPSFLGSNPDTLDEGPQKGLRPLAGEMDLALQLFGMLSPAQKKQARISGELIREIITGAEARARAPEPHGLSAGSMNLKQVEQLKLLIREYVQRYRTECAQDDLNQIKAAGMENIYLAWSGGEQKGERLYYRIQGPTFIMEYANSQDGGNHSHTVWRDFENDFGYSAVNAFRQHLHVHH